MINISSIPVPGKIIAINYSTLFNRETQEIIIFIGLFPRNAQIFQAEQPKTAVLEPSSFLKNGLEHFY